MVNWDYKRLDESDFKNRGYDPNNLRDIYTGNRGINDVIKDICHNNPKFIISTLSSAIPYAITIKEELKQLGMKDMPKFLTINTRALSGEDIHKFASKLKKYGIKSSDDIMILDEHGRGQSFNIPLDYVFDYEKNNRRILADYPSDRNNNEGKAYNSLSRASSIVRQTLNYLGLENKIKSWAIAGRRLGDGSHESYTYWRKNYNSEKGAPPYITPQTSEEISAVRDNHELFKKRVRDIFNQEGVREALRKELMPQKAMGFISIFGFSLALFTAGITFTGNAIGASISTNIFGIIAFIAAAIGSFIFVRDKNRAKKPVVNMN